MKSKELFLSHWTSKDVVSVDLQTTKLLQLHHLPPIRFLYSRYIKKERGAILNQDEGMNFPLQVSAFLNAIKTNVTHKCPVLIVCSEETIVAWHYCLTNYSKFTVGTNANDYGECDALVSSRAQIKANEALLEAAFSVVVVTNHDLVANKLFFRKLKGDFNIGLTTRNFLKYPHEKLQWAMIKWVKPDVGTFNAFAELNNAYLCNFAEPFVECWHRITWNFCEEFVKPVEDVPTDEILSEWADQNGLNPFCVVATVKRVRKRKVSPDETLVENERKTFKREPMSHERNVNKTEENVASLEIKEEDLSEFFVDDDEVAQKNDVKREQLGMDEDTVLSFLF